MEKGRMVCCECLTVADERANGWRAYRADVPGEDPAPILAFYCGPCAELMFGSSRSYREVRRLVQTLRTTAVETVVEEPVDDGSRVGRYFRRRFSR